MIRVVPMSEAECRESIQRAIPRYAASSVRRGHWAEDAALEASRKEYESRYPQGLHTPHRYFVNLVDEPDGTRVGEAWYQSELQGGKVRFWVDWIWIEPEHRRRGFARQTLELLAEEAERQGADRMGLLAYSDNPGAIALYTKLGFVTQTMSMVRELKHVD